MKKTLLALAALLLLFCLAACGEAETLRAAVPTPAPAEESTPRPKASPPSERPVTHEEAEAAPTEEPAPREEAEAAPAVYVLNTNTKKFHAPDCSSVGDMSEKNKQIFEGSREQVEAMGYEACKRCGGGA